jgi:hypothetical protein
MKILFKLVNNSIIKNNKIIYNIWIFDVAILTVTIIFNFYQRNITDNKD